MMNALIIASVAAIVVGLGLMLAAFETYEIDGKQIVETDWKWLSVGGLLVICGVVAGSVLLTKVMA